MRTGPAMRRLRLLSGALCVLAALALSPSGAEDFAFPLQPNSVRLAVIGDMGTGDQFQIDVANQMVKAREAFPFEFVITVGDNIYLGSLPSDFEKAFAVPYKVLLDAGVPFYATLGNHDETNERFYKPFNMNGANYYAFKKGGVHFFAWTATTSIPAEAWSRPRCADAGNGDWKIVSFTTRSIPRRGITVPTSRCGRSLNPCSSSTASTSCSRATTTCTNGFVRSGASITSLKELPGRCGGGIWHLPGSRQKDSIPTARS